MDLPDYQQRIAFWRKQFPHLDSALASLETVLVILASHREQCQPLPLPPQRQHEDSAPSFPLLQVSADFLALDQFRQTFGELALALAPRHAGLEPESLRNHLVAYLDWVQGRETAWPQETDRELLSLIHLALKPQMEKTAATMAQPIDTAGQIFDRCPLCGALPYISDLRNDNRERHLHCVLCASQWVYPRMRCVFCGNLEAESLAYFTVDGTDDMRVDSCARCQGYLKNIDISKCFTPPPMPVEDTASLHLDCKATSSGLTKSTPNYLGLLAE